MRRRYKKKVEKDDEYIKQVKALGDAVEGDIKQNYAIDIYQVRRLPHPPTAGPLLPHRSQPPPPIPHPAPWSPKAHVPSGAPALRPGGAVEGETVRGK